MVESASLETYSHLIQMIKPNSDQLKQLTEALLDGFDHAGLTRLTRVYFDLHLERITPVAGKRDLTIITENLVAYFASQKGGLKQLLSAAIEDNPDNEELKLLVAKWANLDFAIKPLPYVANEITQEIGSLPFYVPFLQNPNFVGRDKELAVLHNMLMGSESDSSEANTSFSQKPQPITITPAGLTGQGGVGKTQLAVEYAYRCREGGQYQGCYVEGIFWLNGAIDLDDAFAQLGIHLQPDMELQTKTQQVRVATDYLQTHPDSLLILDNVEDPALLNRPLMSSVIPAGLSCRMLFTTRRQDVGKFQILILKILDPEAALKLLLSHEERQSVRQSLHPEHIVAQRICALLGYLPLALEIAAAHLGNRTMKSLNVYESALRSRGALAVTDDDRGGVRAEDLGTRHQAAVAATLAEQWNLLGDDQVGMDAKLLLRVAGQLANTMQVSVALLGLLADVDGTDNDFFGSPLEEAIKALKDISLVEGLNEGKVRLHELVHEFAALQTLEETVAAFRNNCLSNIYNAFSNISTLENHVAIRGVTEVERDLRAVLPLHLGHDRNEQLTLAGLQSLLHLLEKESHSLHSWDRKQNEAGLAQQLLIQAQIQGMVDWAKQFTTRLGVITGNHFVPLWHTSESSPTLLRNFTGHNNSVNSLIITTDGRYALSASSDKTIKLWDLESGKELKSFSGHRDSVNSVAVTPDDRCVISASSDTTIKLWDLESGKELKSFFGHRDS
ncbi:MAG: hypothetical protein KDE09_13950, partial [Anaerolineales bacterium]|nr:hypothetical protein [Anaerolineales bacterium]